MSKLQFFIRHQTSFLQEKMILVFKSKGAKEYFQEALTKSHFEEITSESAQHAIRIGIKGNVIPYGYTLRLTDDEMNQLSTTDWERTAELLAEGNERLYREMLNKKGETRHEKGNH